MNTQLFLVALLLSLCHSIYGQGGSALWGSNNPRDCESSVVLAGDLVNGSVTLDLNPLTGFEAARKTATNSSAHQEWYFESTASNGRSHMVAVFFRNPPWFGNTQTVNLDAVWPNGTKTANTLAFQESRISTCPDRTVGIWKSSNPETWVGFTVSLDSRTATVIADTANISGTWRVDSNTLPHYISGQTYPDPQGSLTFAPYVWWWSPIPSGRASTAMRFGNTPFRLQGYGGHDNFLTAYNPWDLTCKGWIWVRIITGPYTAQIWQFTSSIDDKTYISAFLSRDGRTVFVSQEVLEPSQKATFTNVSQLFNQEEAAHGIFDEATGFVLDLTEGGSEGRSWHFETKHTHVGLSSPLKSTMKFNRYVDTARGGQQGVGEEAFAGSANSEQIVITVNRPLPV